MKAMVPVFSLEYDFLWPLILQSQPLFPLFSGLLLTTFSLKAPGR